MTETKLMVARGARCVTWDELREIKAPEPQGRWFPLAHGRVVEIASEALKAAGYVIAKSEYAVWTDQQRFFGTMDLSSPLAVGVNLAVGIRSSINQSMPLGFCCGTRVLCCTNLAFAAERSIKTKHTRFGEKRYQEGIVKAVASLKEFRELEVKRIEALRSCEMTNDTAYAAIVRALKAGVVTNPVVLRNVVKEWDEPSFDDFRPRTAWSLFNAFTTSLRDRAKNRPAEFALQAMRLSRLLDVEVASHVTVA